MKALIEKTYSLLSKREKVALVLLGILLIFCSFLEVFGIAVIIPFMKLIESPELIQQYSTTRMINDLFHSPPHRIFFVILGIGLMLFMTAKYIFVFLVTVVQSFLLIKIQVRFEKILLRSYLYRPFEFHLLSNTSNLYQNVRTVQNLVAAFILPLVSLFSEVSVSIVMIGFMIYYRPKITLVAIVSVILIATIFWLYSRKKLYRYGQDSHNEGILLIKWLNQSFVGIKDIKVSGTQDFFLGKYLHYSFEYSKILQKSVWLNQLARPILENFGFCLLLSYILFVVYQGRSMSEAVPTLILFAGAAFRILPALNRVLGGMMTIRQSQKVANDILDELKADGAIEPTVSIADDSVKFQDKIKIHDLSFQYKNTDSKVLNGLNLEIRKGDFVGIVGASGAGKTTFVDLLLGLMPNYDGEIWVDGKKLSFADGSWQSWQQRIGYVPQSVYLYDESIVKNIAFGVQDKDIDPEKVKEAIRQARLEAWVISLPDREKTYVGDRGTRVSGGQKQRIGIARAFYRNSDILVLDEVTSALDEATESEMLEELRKISQNKTIITITHRQSTLQHCNRVFRLEAGVLKQL